MGFLSNIFSSQPKLEPISLSVFGSDIHSHLIPGIDDGAPDLEASINMIKGLEQVREELVKQNISFDISAAAEYNLDDGLADLIEKKQILTFGENYVLFELPFMSEPPNFQEIVFNFQMAGYKPVLAHPERYSFWYDNFDKYEELKSKGILLQMNLLSLTGHYSPQTKKVAEKMVDANLIDAVGSDCHRIEHLMIIENHLNSPHIHKLAQKENLLNKKL